MPSVQRFFSGQNNLARAAALNVSSVRAAQAVERLSARRAGNGRVRVAGEYIGHEATQIDVEIVAADGVPRASVPQFVGVGNGTLTVQDVDAAAPLQALTFTLADLGVATAAARLDLREVQIRARNPGAAGNAIRITVTPQLTRTTTAWALLSDWPAGTAVQTGVQWDFGALPLSTGGELDADSGRIQFGFDPQVYRPWRQFKDGAWQFGLSPSLERDVPEGAAVYAVTGGYLVTVTDGLTTETFGDTSAMQPEISSFYDLLGAMQGSALVEVAGVVAADRAVGGQAAVDVPLRTQAWLYQLTGKVTLADVSVPPAAPTQKLTVRCINSDVAGQERWSVTGTVSGELPVATTGEAYASTAANFLVPVINPASMGSGDWSFKYTPTNRSDTEGLPAVCVRPFIFGRNAQAKTITFRYSKRPPADCSCADEPTPRVPVRCLGLTQGVEMALDAEYQTRLEALYLWRSGFMHSNTNMLPAPRFAANDMDLADAITTAFADALAQVFGEAAATTEWDAALASMETDIAWMMGLNDDPTLNLSRAQGGVTGTVWINPDSDRLYQAMAVRGTGQHAMHHVYPETEGWIPADDPVWDESGALFTVSYTFSDGDTMEVDYRCLPYTAKDYSAEVTDSAPHTFAMALQQLVRRYLARMDYVLTLAGIVPKSESSGGDAGGCWIDHGDDFWWEDVDNYYLPAFTNHAYISARRNPDTGKAYSTMEFGFGLVVACPDRLKLGDELTIRIDQVDADRPYQAGDEAVISTIAAGPAWLTGGVDGTDVQTWRAAGSASGVLPDYVVPTNGTPAPVWSHAGIDLQLALGGIPFSLGDVFSLAVEAGQWRWRRTDAGVIGAWSALADIPATGPAALVDGLSVHFDAGAAPSFVPGDAYGFAVHQPWAASHARDASASVWGWAGASAELMLDLGAVQPLAAVALARYQLPDGATVHAAFSDDGLTWSAPVALDVSGAVCVHFADVAARHVRISIANAADGRLGWVWAGQPLATDHHASTCQRRRRWATQRADGFNPSALYAGKGDGWSLAWQPGDAAASRLLEADMDQLMTLLDWAQQSDEPLMFVPHHLHPRDAALLRFSADSLDVRDAHEWQANETVHRMLSASLDLEPVYA